MLAKYFWTWGLPGNVVDITCVTPLEQNWFALSQQVLIDNCFLVNGGTYCLLPLLSVGIPSGLNLCRSYRYWHKFCELYLYQSVCIQKKLFLWSHVPSLVFKPSVLHGCMLMPSREHFKGNIPFRTEHLKVSNSLHVVLLWVCMLTTSCCKTKLYLWVLAYLLICLSINLPTTAVVGPC